MSLVQTIYCKFIYIILNIYMIVTFCFSFFYQVSVKIWLIEKSPHLVMQKNWATRSAETWFGRNGCCTLNKSIICLACSVPVDYICLHLLWVSTHHTLFLNLGVRQRSPSTKSPKHVNLVKRHFCECFFFCNYKWR